MTGKGIAFANDWPLADGGGGSDLSHKRAALRDLCDLIDSGFERGRFTERAYSALSARMFGHIAEFTIHGFHGAWFSTPQRQAAWVARAARGGPWGFHDAARPELWGDVEHGVAAYLEVSGAAARVTAEAAATVEREERAQLAALLAKYGGGK
jgi:hypothetical protein